MSANASQAELLASLPLPEREAVLREFSDADLTALEYDWGFWGRQNQFPPSGDWSVWLVCAGRGFGKTRTGAEWCREQVTKKGKVRLALVAPTAADARDVMVEGESGLLNVFPDHERPIYEPSKRKVTFSNGAIAMLYSSEEPERLRGPQHDAAWCFPAEVPVTMADGSQLPIADVKPGMLVATPGGPRRVLASAMTRRDAEIWHLETSDGRVLPATGNHLVFVNGSYQALSSVAPGGELRIVHQIAKVTPNITISRVYKTSRKASVYDLTIADAHEFFAAGILVHNCDELAAWSRMQGTWDMLQFGLRLGDNPQCVITTTPKPLPLVKELVADPATAITRGNTYDNKANLAKKFVEKIVKKYEGTRLGRQELEAEILDDIPGALWTWALIERARYLKVCPEFSYKVVAIDPSTGDGNPDNDECGIIVAGLGYDDFGYVLHDGSMTDNPDAWAARAVQLYHDLKCNWIIAEANNGGKLIESAIAAQPRGRNVPVKLVHASQGKRTRAEPVSMLYQQGRIRHYGIFPDLENQLTNWSPKDSEYSPGRMDALVWAFTGLMVENPGEFFAFIA